MFHRYQTELDTAVLGFLQVDSKGNVNVSKRGPKVTDYVGPGGFPDIVAGARTIIFIGKWSPDAQFKVENGQVKLVKTGTPKFVEQVDEVTFNGQVGLQAGKHIYYITNVGLFQLLPEGLTLRAVFPGIDIERDVLAHARARIIVPPADVLERIDGGIVSGEGYRLESSYEELVV
jgi:propionate CoA-transferase